jgi:tetratricopeptide (TPR) repeat protein
MRVGGVRRGTQYISNTSERQVEAMAHYLQKASLDFDRALSLNGRLVHALAYKMEIPMALGGAQHETRELRDRALAINPHSLTARWYYIMSRLPRWGGSIPEIAAEVEAARPYYNANPALKALEGRVDTEYGDQAFFSGQFSNAVSFYTRALQHGPHWYYYSQRGKALSAAQQFNLSNQDFLLALQLRPNNSTVLYGLGFNLYKMSYQFKEKKYLTEAVDYLSKAVDNNPYDHKAFDIRGDAYFFLGQNNSALADFERALALDPANNEYRQDVQKAKAALAAKKSR